MVDPSIEGIITEWLKQLRDDIVDAVGSLPDITLNPGDIEIGAVEVKDHDSDIRANVTANGIEVDNKTLPPDASKESTQEDILTSLSDLLTELESKPESSNDEMGNVLVDGTNYVVKFAVINATAAGDTTVVAAVALKKIRIIGIDIVTSADTDVAWKSAANTKRNAQTYKAGGGLVRECKHGYFVETNAGEALIVNLSAIANVRGAISYIEV